MTRSNSEEPLPWLLGRTMSLRARRAVERMIEVGFVTTADLNDMGYDHPPRAIADAKDAGIQIKTTMVIVDGRRMARYELSGEMIDEGMSGRHQLSKAFRNALYRKWDFRCAICRSEFSSRELQADHRIPFRISGDSAKLDLDDFMPLCPSCNRAKSWTCETCPNWTQRTVAMCTQCFWMSPDRYLHIAGKPERRLDITWAGQAEVDDYARLAAGARAEDMTISDFAKSVLSDSTREQDHEQGL